MEIPNEFVSIGATAVVGLQCWTLAEVVKLKTKVAVIIATCDACDKTKNSMPTIKRLAALAILAPLILFTGCAALTPNEQPAGFVSQPVYSLDTATGLLTQSGTTNLPVSAIGYTVNTNVTAALQAAQAMTAAGASIPSPASPFLALATGLLGLAGAGLTVFARHKSGQLTTANAALAATITAIEAAELIGTKNEAQKLAVANGSQSYLDAAVQRVTKELP